jgi:diguanylate cyclase (GGDEF)-like protein/PAS domain S-box-containing protein
VLTREGPVLMGEARFAVAQSEARYRHLIKRMAALVVELAPTGEILYLNEALTHVTGFSAKKLIGSSWLELLLPVHDSMSLNLLRQSFLENGELTDFRTSIRSFDGSRKIFSWNSVNVCDVNGLIERIICFGINITSQVLAEQELAIAAIAFESQEGMIVTDAHGMILRVNKAFTTITGYTAEEAIGKNPRMLKSGHQSADFYAAMWTDINNNDAWSGEIWNQRKNGECYPERLTITAVKGPNGIVTNYVGTLADITMSTSAAEKIRHLAFYDPLTDLPNRLLLRDRLKPALASSNRSGRRGALLFIDMDNFKTLNDSLGHDMGDLLLQQVARRLELCVREGDTVARSGGDEFIVMLEDLSEQVLEAGTQTENIGNKILATLNSPYQLAMHYYHCSPSIGAILFNDHEQSVDELLKQADIKPKHQAAIHCAFSILKCRSVLIIVWRWKQTYDWLWQKTSLSSIISHRLITTARS